MTTKEMLDIALGLAKLEEGHQDSGVELESSDVKRVLAGIDMGGAEILAAKQLGYDCVASHHPHSARMAKVGEMMQRDHFEMMVHFGVPINVAQKISAELAAEVNRNNQGRNITNTMQLARLLGLSMLCIHTPADIIVERAMRERMDKLASGNERLRLGDIVENLLEVREYKEADQGPMIWLGNEDSYAGKIMVTMTGVGPPRIAEYKACVDAGVGTIICMHMTKEIFDELKKDNRCNVIVAGHMASDSYGFNRILEAWEAGGVEVTRVGGIV